MEVLNHPNIIKFIDVYRTHKGKLCIAMEYADGGDIDRDIKRQLKKSQKTGKIEYLKEDSQYHDYVNTQE